jgi:serine/threonine protein kinase
MGEVYLAEHIELGRKEALKILMPSLAADPAFVQRFRREARAVNRLRHPNIITVYDFGQLPDGRFYLSMEYAGGPSVKTLLLRDGSFAVHRALHVLGQLAYAVHHAHSRGVLHRDLKPDNLICTGEDETLKVLDFGVAKIVAVDQPESAAISNTNVVWGSPRYMAPERIAGVGDDPRSDLYAIGCIAYELAVGAPPFNGEADDIIKGHLSDLPEPPRTVRPDIPRELEDAILRLLEKDVESRFQTAAEAFAALRKVPGYPGPKFAARRKFKPVDRAPAELVLKPDRPNRGALRELADALLDLGLNDTRLVSGIARLRDHEQSVAALEATQDALEHELVAVRETTSDREASLRFALGELELAASDPDHPPEVDDRIQDLRNRLNAALTEKARLRKLEDDLSNAEMLRVKGLANLKTSYEELERVVDDLLPTYASHPTIAALAGRLAAVRRLRTP